MAWTLNAESQRTTAFPAARGTVDFSVKGTFVGTVQLDRSLDGGATWETLAAYAAPIPAAAAPGQAVNVAADGTLLSFSTPAGGWTSGTATCRLAQSPGRG